MNIEYACALERVATAARIINYLGQEIAAGSKRAIIAKNELKNAIEALDSPAEYSWSSFDCEAALAEMILQSE